MTGKLELFSLNDVLNVITQGNMSGILNITTDDGITGTCSFDNGKLVDAKMGRLTGDEAANQVFSWAVGVFAFIPSVFEGKITVTESLEKLMFDSCMRADEDIAELGRSISGTSHIHLSKDTNPPVEVDLDPNEWIFLSHVEEATSVAQIIHEMGMSTDEARRILSKLIRHGFVHVVSE